MEAVYVEGHTDNIQIVGRLSDGSTNNLELSSKRATNTYQQIVAQRPELKTFQNPEKQQALSVAAYGEQATDGRQHYKVRPSKEQTYRHPIRYVCSV